MRIETTSEMKQFPDVEAVVGDESNFNTKTKEELIGIISELQMNLFYKDQESLAKVQATNNQLESLQTRLIEKETKILGLTSKLQAHEDTIFILQSELDLSKNANLSLADNFQRRSEEVRSQQLETISKNMILIEKLTEEKSSLQQAVDDLKEEATRRDIFYKQQLRSLQKKLQEKETESLELTSKLQAHEDSIFTLQTELEVSRNASVAMADKFKSRSEEVRSEQLEKNYKNMILIEKLTVENSSLQQAVNDLKEEATRRDIFYKQQLKSLQTNLNEKETAILELTSKLQAHEDSMFTLQTELEVSQNQSLHWKCKADSFNQELRFVRHQLSETEDANSKQVEDMIQEQSSLQLAVKDLQDEATNMDIFHKQQLKSLQTNLDEKETAILELTSQLQAHEGSIFTLQTELEVSQNQSLHWKCKADSSNQELEFVRLKLSETEDANRKQVEDMIQEQSSLQTRIRDLENDACRKAAFHRHQVESLQAELDNKATENSQLESRIEANEDHISTLQGEIERLHEVYEEELSRANNLRGSLEGVREIVGGEISSWRHFKKACTPKSRRQFKLETMVNQSANMDRACAPDTLPRSERLPQEQQSTSGETQA
ncbi:ERC protein 2-like [Cheilinus undulatus]|uniref:ERC protein 2-like n=1 Tax=Cheilinus undulatus TaxID=241271 RepID=UPI001BD4394C|nr:ERC protein 2-like [Cheilinus undulatus]